MTAYIIGPNPFVGVSVAGMNMWYFQQHVAAISGVVSELYIKANIYSGTLNAMVALYSDNAGSPGNVLASSGDTSLVNGWNIISVSPANVASGSTYWLSFNSNGTGTLKEIYRNNSGGISKRKSATYSGFTFTDNPTGLSDNTSIVGLVGYGTVGGASVGLIGDGLIGERVLFGCEKLFG